MTDTPTTDPGNRRRLTLALTLDDDNNADDNAAEALLHLIRWFDAHAIPVDATLHIPGSGTLSATTRPTTPT